MRYITVESYEPEPKKNRLKNLILNCVLILEIVIITYTWWNYL